MPQNDKHKIYLLAGPTASGKSAKALEWAGATGGTIINADSMQHYHDVSILTARPDEDETRLAPHALYGHLAPQDSISVGDWIRSVKPYIDKALSGGKPICIVGGTGLYFNALIKGLAEIPPVEVSVRLETKRLFDELGETAFREKLRSFDARAEARISPQDQQRLKRAYEVYTATRTSLSDWQTQTHPLLTAHSYHFEILKPERDWLYQRCDERLLHMIDKGALEQVRALISKGLKPDWPIMRVLGLAELSAYLRGEIELNDALALAQQKTRNYAKRQTTWFNNQFSGL